MDVLDGVSARTILVVLTSLHIVLWTSVFLCHLGFRPKPPSANVHALVASGFVFVAARAFVGAYDRRPPEWWGNCCWFYALVCGLVYLYAIVRTVQFRIDGAKE